MGRTDQILDAISRALAARRAEIDEATDLSAVVVDVKLRPGTWTPRRVIVRPEHETEISSDWKR